MRQILVFDKDKAFISLLQNMLSVYGFEVQAEEPEPDKVHKINSVQPEAVFIAFDKSDKKSYILCSEARKMVGKEVPIILVIAMLSPQDLSLYRRLNLDADIYLDKRTLTRKELLEKLDELIGLGIRTGPLASETDKGFLKSKEVEEIALNEDESGLLKDSHGAATDDLHHRLAEQENEISHLRQQLEELLHNVKPAASSNSFIVGHEQKDQEDLEITKLSEKVQDSNRELLTGRKKLKELTEQIAQLEQEIDQGIERTKELTAIFNVAQKMNGEPQSSTDMLTQRRQEHQETNRQDEYKITEQKAAIMDMEKQHLDQLQAADENRKNELIQAEEDNKQLLEDLEKSYTDKLAQLQSEKDAEIEALKQKIKEETQRVSDEMDKGRQAHQETLKQYEDKIAELEALIKEAEKKHLLQLQAVNEKQKTELLKAEDFHSNVVNSIVKRYDAKLAQLKAEVNKEHQSHMETRKQYENKISLLLEQHSDAYKKAELRHAARIAELQSEKDAAIEALKKKLLEDGEMSLGMLKKED